MLVCSFGRPTSITATASTRGAGPARSNRALWLKSRFAEGQIFKTCRFGPLNDGIAKCKLYQKLLDTVRRSSSSEKRICLAGLKDLRSDANQDIREVCLSSLQICAASSALNCAHRLRPKAESSAASERKQGFRKQRSMPFRYRLASRAINFGEAGIARPSFADVSISSRADLLLP